VVNKMANPSLPYPTTGLLALVDNFDAVKCRQTVRSITAGLKFSVTGQTMLVTAASELARNTLIHGGGGRFSWEVDRPWREKGRAIEFRGRRPWYTQYSASHDEWLDLG
jgi:serine/threonine-protein kinase RsbT